MIFDDCGIIELQQFDQLIIIGDCIGLIISCLVLDVDMNGLFDIFVYVMQGSICMVILEVFMLNVSDDCSGWIVIMEVVIVM